MKAKRASSFMAQMCFRVFETPLLPNAKRPKKRQKKQGRGGGGVAPVSNFFAFSAAANERHFRLFVFCVGIFDFLFFFSLIVAFVFTQICC
jgi:hypothetical protein